MRVRRLVVTVAPWLPVVAVGAFAAYFQVFTFFSTYDDEGYVLVSLAEFLRGGSLFDDVYTQYGPFYYLLFGSLFDVLGLPVTTDAGRLIVVGVWLGTATLYGVAAHRLTGRLGIGIAAQVTAFMTLRLLVAEPMHPVGLTALLLAVVLAIAPSQTGRPLATAGWLGLLVAALAMTKINVGALAAIAVAAAAGLCLPPLRDRPLVRNGSLILLVITPAVLLGPDLDRTWVRELLLLELAALAATAIALRRGRWAAEPRVTPGPPGTRWLSVFLGVTVAALLVIVLVTLALGTSVSGLVDGVLIEPTRLRDVFVLPLRLPQAASYGAVAAVAVAVVVSFVPGVPHAAPGLWPPLVRIVLAVMVWSSVALTWPLPSSLHSWRLALPMLVAWVAAVPPRGVAEGPGMAFARVLSVVLAILGVLQSYPVAGTQQAAAALGFVPVGALLLGDGVRGIEAWVMPRFPSTRWAPLVGIAIVALLVAKFTVAGVLRPLEAFGRKYDHGSSLAVHGAARLRLPPADAAQYRRIVRRIRTNCDTFISLPGLNSFYLWSDLRPPTRLNTGDWMFLLDDHQQQRIVAAVRDVPRLCLIRSDPQMLLWLWKGRGESTLPDGPLLRFILRTKFRRLDLALGGLYELLVRP